jgi:hypothetical protein
MSVSPLLHRVGREENVTAHARADCRSFIEAPRLAGINTTAIDGDT